MKILFLDIDGVINTMPKLSSLGDFNAKACKALNTLLSNTPELKVVISSSWRVYGLQAVKDILAHNNIVTDNIIGHVGEAKGTVREQIKKWLAKNKNITNFVILDDEDDFAELRPHLVRTNCFTGVTSKDIKQVMALLKKFESLH